MRFDEKYVQYTGIRETKNLLALSKLYSRTFRLLLSLSLFVTVSAARVLYKEEKNTTVKKEKACTHLGMKTCAVCTFAAM